MMIAVFRQRGGFTHINDQARHATSTEWELQGTPPKQNYMLSKRMFVNIGQVNFIFPSFFQMISKFCEIPTGLAFYTSFYFGIKYLKQRKLSAQNFIYHQTF